MAQETGVDNSAPWPRLLFESHEWRPSEQLPDALLTRRQAEIQREPYQAAVPPSIAETEVRLPSQLDAEVSSATIVLAKFDEQVPEAFTSSLSPLLLRSEAASSSQIENLTSGARAIAETAIGERATGNANLIVQNGLAMSRALGVQGALTDRVILEMQAAILGNDPALTGRYRAEQVWIGGRYGFHPHGAEFVPPHHDRVPAAMADLLRFVARDDLQPLVKIAIAHAQFETIHPFPDGNGRTGRALVHAMLNHERVMRRSVIPMSAGLLRRRDAYFSALGSYREGDPIPIVEAFVGAAQFAVVNSNRLIEDLQGIKETWLPLLSGLRSDAVAWRILDLALQQPVLSAAVVVDQTGGSMPSVLNGLSQLTERGVLVSANSKQRNRIWLAHPVIDALDAFAERTRR